VPGTPKKKDGGDQVTVNNSGGSSSDPTSLQPPTPHILSYKILNVLMETIFVWVFQYLQLTIIFAAN
jgi:hypothetical protein